MYRQPHWACIIELYGSFKRCRLIAIVRGTIFIQALVPDWNREKKLLKSISLFQHYNVHTEFGTLDMFNIENFAADIKVFSELIKNIETLDDFEIWGILITQKILKKLKLKKVRRELISTISNKKTIQEIFHNFPVSSWRRKCQN